MPAPVAANATNAVTNFLLGFAYSFTGYAFYWDGAGPAFWRVAGSQFVEPVRTSWSAATGVPWGNQIDLGLNVESEVATAANEDNEYGPSDFPLEVIFNRILGLKGGFFAQVFREDLTEGGIGVPVQWREYFLDIDGESEWNSSAPAAAFLGIFIRNYSQSGACMSFHDIRSLCILEAFGTSARNAPAGLGRAASNRCEVSLRLWVDLRPTTFPYLHVSITSLNSVGARPTTGSVHGSIARYILFHCGVSKHGLRGLCPVSLRQELGADDGDTIGWRTHGWDLNVEVKYRCVNFACSKSFAPFTSSLKRTEASVRVGGVSDQWESTLSINGSLRRPCGDCTDRLAIGGAPWAYPILILRRIRHWVRFELRKSVERARVESLQATVRPSLEFQGGLGRIDSTCN
ncbi:hypothetical protein R3P38DRAFT_2808984 [Favolaschia claudopus]|uniref:Uncharacterized protein n=1 Tax=Favolaschia claudopus TaxID=2862362 RepID=A0AAV9ZEJ0_9AGAR